MRRRLGIAVLCALGALAAAAPAAHAERPAFSFGYDLTNDGNVCTAAPCFAGRGGTGPGALNSPTDAVVVGDEVFVSETDNHRVSVFDLATGAFKLAFGANVGGPGINICTTSCAAGAFAVCTTPSCTVLPGYRGDSLSGPAGMTLHAGQLFVAETRTNRVSVWDPGSKTFVRAFGKDVGGPGIDACTGASACVRPGSFGTAAGRLSRPGDVAVAAGEAFVPERSGFRVSVFDAASGAFARAFGKDAGGPGVDVCTSSCVFPTPTGAAGGLGEPVGVAVSGDKLLVADRLNSRVAVYSRATSTFLRAIGTDVGGPGVNTCSISCTAGGFGSGAGQITLPSAVAIIGNEFWVSEREYNGRVSAFDLTTETFLRAFGKDIGGPGVDTCTTTCQPGTFSVNPGATEMQPGGVTIADGRLIVVDTGYRRLSVFDPASGAFRYTSGLGVRPSGAPSEFERCRSDCQPGGSDDGPGSLRGAHGVATAGGEVFVADYFNGRINVYSAASGLFLRAFGKNVGGLGIDTCTSFCQGDFEESGSRGDAGRIVGVSGVAIAGGEVFVVSASNRVSVFNGASGAFLRGFGKGVGGPGVDICTTSCVAVDAGSGAGQLNSAFALAVAGGEVFVAESGNNRVSVFNAASGAFQRAFGRDVGGAGVHMCTVTCQAGTSGSGAGRLNGAIGVALAGGQVFVAETTNRRVSVFTAATGTFVRAFGKNVGGIGVDVCTITCQGGSGSLRGGSGEIFAPTAVSVHDGEVYVAGGFGRIAVYTPAGTWLRAFGVDVGGSGIHTCTSTCRPSRFGAGFGELAFPNGLAVTDSAVFVGDLGANRVTVFSSSSDDTAPNTSITAGPAGSTTDTTPTFAFRSSGGGSEFECRVDSGSFQPCATPLTTAALSEGEHTFSVRAIDAAWNWDATPANRRFTVDTTAPETTITAGPNGRVETSTPTFEHASSEPGSSAECRVDSGPFEACASPFTTLPLSLGAHTVEIRAVDGAGNRDETPEVRALSVERPVPPPPPTVQPPDVRDPAVFGYPDALYPGKTKTASASNRDSTISLQIPATCVRTGQQMRIRLTWKRKKRKGNLFVKISRTDFSIGGKLVKRDTAAPFTQVLTVPSTAKPGTTIALRARAFIKMRRGKSPTKSLNATVRVCQA